MAPPKTPSSSGPATEENGDATGGKDGHSEEKTLMHIWVTKVLKNQVKAYGDEHGRTMTDVIIAAVTKYLETEGMETQETTDIAILQRLRQIEKRLGEIPSEIQTNINVTPEKFKESVSTKQIIFGALKTAGKPIRSNVLAFNLGLKPADTYEYLTQLSKEGKVAEMDDGWVIA